MTNMIGKIILIVICIFTIIVNILNIAKRDGNDGIFISNRNAMIQNVLLVIMAITALVLVLMQ